MSLEQTFETIKKYTLVNYYSEENKNIITLFIGSDKAIKYQAVGAAYLETNKDYVIKYQKFTGKELDNASIKYEKNNIENNKIVETDINEYNNAKSKIDIYYSSIDNITFAEQPNSSWNTQAGAKNRVNDILETVKELDIYKNAKNRYIVGIENGIVRINPEALDNHECEQWLDVGYILFYKPNENSNLPRSYFSFTLPVIFQSESVNIAKNEKINEYTKFADGDIKQDRKYTILKNLNLGFAKTVGSIMSEKKISENIYSKDPHSFLTHKEYMDKKPKEEIKLADVNYMREIPYSRFNLLKEGVKILLAQITNNNNPIVGPTSKICDIKT
jgi:hypothetical protein